MGAKWFGASVKRKEDPALLSGKGRFVDDIQLPGMLHAAFVRSSHAHARIRGVDVAAARTMPGVHLALSFAELPQTLQNNALPLFVPHAAIGQPFMPHALASTEACYVGEPLAVVVADSRYLAEDAAAAVTVDYEPLPAVTDCAAAIEPASHLAHVDASSNIAARFPISHGDTDKAFAAAKHVFRESIHLHRGGALSLECRGLIATHDLATDSFTVYLSSQGSHRIKRAMLDVLDLHDNQMRVITPDVGGGFGPKGAFYPEYPTIAHCARTLKRPVKWIEDRYESFLATHQERDQCWDVEIGVDDDGKIFGLRGRLIHESGAFVPWV
jgi:aerobic carbon-monoxide dehydrogenase large subunit